MIPRIVVTPGDPDGIGPEILEKALKICPKNVHYLCIGSKKPFRKSKHRWLEIQEGFTDWDFLFRKNKNGGRYFLAAPERAEKFLQGFQSGWAIEQAVKLLKNKNFQALATGPISKERLQAGGFAFQGHTDFISHLVSTEKKKFSATMMLANSHLRVSLVTTHLPLSKVSEALSAQKITRCVEHTLHFLQTYFPKKIHSIAILAVNPHAGENGILGSEENKIIIPTLQTLQKKWKKNVTLTGPHPADAFFANYINTKRQKRPDVVIGMYHDQVLTPVKMLDFPHTINISLGLPILRTSVDHGVAFDIAGKNKADPSSMVEAIRAAIEFSKVSR